MGILYDFSFRWKFNRGDKYNKYCAVISLIWPPEVHTACCFLLQKATFRVIKVHKMGKLKKDKTNKSKKNVSGTAFDLHVLEEMGGDKVYPLIQIPTIFFFFNCSACNL